VSPASALCLRARFFTAPAFILHSDVLKLASGGNSTEIFSQ